MGQYFLEFQIVPDLCICSKFDIDQTYGNLTISAEEVEQLMNEYEVVVVAEDEGKRSVSIIISDFPESSIHISVIQFFKWSLSPGGKDVRV